MYYKTVGLLIILLQAILIINTRLLLYPEMYFFPWMVSRGFLPYIDFFDHHGFLFYYLLSPLLIFKSEIIFKVVFTAIQLLNTFLVLVILKQQTNKIGYIIGGIIYFQIAYLVSENILWFENLITAFYLIGYYINSTKNDGILKYLFGISIALASFLKPTALIIIFLFFLIKNYIKNLIIIIILWTFFLFFLIIKNGLYQFIYSIFLYNFFLSLKYPVPIISQNIFWMSLLFVYSLSLLLIFTGRKIGKALFLILLIPLCIIFLYPGLFQFHFLPIAAFLSILIGYVFNIQSAFNKKFYFIIIIIFTMNLSWQVYINFKYLNNNPNASIGNINLKEDSVIASELKKQIKDRKIYVFGNRPQIYMALDRVPPTYYPIQFPYIKYFMPDYEKNIIKELKNNDIEYIYVNKPLDRHSDNLINIKNYIKDEYYILNETEKYKLFKKHDKYP